jgi:hypothetical protein
VQRGKKIITGEQRAALRWLAAKHVRCRSRQFAGFQGFIQSVFIDQFAARRIDQISAIAHLSDPFRVDQPLRFGGNRAVK